MSKYDPLSRFLERTQAGAQRLTFSKVEEILGFELPVSAYRYEAWWSNNETGHSHARSWIESGWRTESVDLAGRKVTFRRSAPDAPTTPPERPDPWGCMAGTVTFMPGVDLTKPTGDIWNAEEGRLFNE